MAPVRISRYEFDGVDQSPVRFLANFSGRVGVFIRRDLPYLSRKSPAIPLEGDPVSALHNFKKNLEHAVEATLFASRWLLAPFYIGLAAALILLLTKFVQEFWHFAQGILSGSTHDIQLGLLGLLDMTLLANLILIMIFAGYENFVSKIGTAVDAEDRPHWMGRVDYSGLKIKLIGSLVAISVIELLKDFMNAEHIDTTAIKWRLAIHLTFVISGVLFAVMDWVAEARHAAEFEVSEHIEAEKKATKKKS